MSWIAIGTALWLGILTSISPCPLASNIAAISFVSRHVGDHKSILLSGSLYTIGRTLAYLLLGVLILCAFQ
jgi:cytochrome c biogenesis protein CcdA